MFFPIFVQAEDILLEKNTAVLKATGGNVWVQVFSAEETAYMGTLEGGETTTVTFDDNLVVWTGKAENLEFIVNGKDMGSAGTGVMKNIMITAQGIEFKSSELDFFNSPQNVNGAWDNGHIKVLRLTDASSVDFSFYIFVFSEEGIWEYIDKIHLEWQR